MRCCTSTLPSAAPPLPPALASASSAQACLLEAIATPSAHSFAGIDPYAMAGLISQEDGLFKARTRQGVADALYHANYRRPAI